MRKTPRTLAAFSPQNDALLPVKSWRDRSIYEIHQIIIQNPLKPQEALRHKLKLANSKSIKVMFGRFNTLSKNLGWGIRFSIENLLAIKAKDLERIVNQKSSKEYYHSPGIISYPISLEQLPFSYICRCLAETEAYHTAAETLGVQDEVLLSYLGKLGLFDPEILNCIKNRNFKLLPNILDKHGLQYANNGISIKTLPFSKIEFSYIRDIIIKSYCVSDAAYALGVSSRVFNNHFFPPGEEPSKFVALKTYLSSCVEESAIQTFCERRHFCWKPSAVQVRQGDAENIVSLFNDNFLNGFNKVADHQQAPDPDNKNMFNTLLTVAATELKQLNELNPVGMIPAVPKSLSSMSFHTTA